MPPPPTITAPPDLAISDKVFIGLLDIEGAGPRALLSLAAARPDLARTVTPLAIEGDAAGVGPSAFPASETGGAAAAAISFAGPDSARPAVTLLVVAAPLTTPAAAAGVAAGLARLLPAGAEVGVVAALAGLRPPSSGTGGGGGDAAAPTPTTTATAADDAGARVADPAVAALLHALAGTGHGVDLVAVRGHRPAAAAAAAAAAASDGRGGGGEVGDGAAAATELGKAAAVRAPPGLLRFAPERAARLVPSLAALRSVGGGGEAGGGGAPREPEAGGLLYC